MFYEHVFDWNSADYVAWWMSTNGMLHFIISDNNALECNEWNDFKRNWDISDTMWRQHNSKMADNEIEMSE